MNPLTLEKVMRMVGRELPPTLQTSLDEIKADEVKVKEMSDALPENVTEATAEQKSAIIEANKLLEEKAYKFLDDLEVQGIRLKLDANSRAQRDQDYGHLDTDLPQFSKGVFGHGDNSRSKSIGQVVTDSKDFMEWCKACKSRSTPNGNSPAVVIGDYDMKTLITGASSTSAGAFIVTDRRPMTEEGLYFRPLSVLDLISFSGTDSDTIDYVEETGFTNNAATVAEATSSADGLKPESAATWVVKQSAIQIIAHMDAVTRNALADVPRLRSIVDNMLRYGVREELEDLIIGGDGVTPNLLGMENVSGTLSQAFVTDIFTTYRKAITAIQRPGNDGTPGGNAEPDLYIMHPVDWENIELSYDNNQRYYYGGPTALGEKRLWGRRVVTSFGATQGAPILTTTRFHEGFVREGITIRATESHSDWFRRNMVAILAEGRFGYILRRPAATCIIATS